MLDKVDVEDVWYAFLEAHTAAESTLEQHDVLTLDIALDRAVFMYEAERDIVGALGVINKALGPVDGLPKAESRILADQPSSPKVGKGHSKDLPNIPLASR